jgi:hypothetical protein
LLNESMGWLSGKLSGGKYQGEGWMGDALYDFLHRAENPEVKNNVSIAVNVDGNGRVTATTNDMNTNIGLPRGKF